MPLVHFLELFATWYTEWSDKNWAYPYRSVKGAKVPFRSVRMDSPLIQMFLQLPKMDIHTLAEELRSYPWEWGNLRLWRATLRNPHGALQNVRETSAVGGSSSL